jgi:Stage II sporulation protein E (SpoIIE)
VRLRLDLAVSVPKDPERQDLNEDQWACDDVVTRLAVSDGASESFDSRTWARLLVDRYVQDTGITPDWVEQVLEQYLASSDFSNLSWSKQAAFERGSFATLLGVELAPEGGQVEVIGLGDSVAFLVAGGLLKVSFPYTTPEEFDARPQLLSTITANNAFVGEPGFFGENTSKTWFVESGDILLLATDAVAQWMLREQGESPTAIERLLTTKDAAAFEALVLQLRLERRIRLDDSTVLRLVVEEG